MFLKGKGIVLIYFMNKAFSEIAKYHKIGGYITFADNVLTL